MPISLPVITEVCDITLLCDTFMYTPYPALHVSIPEKPHTHVEILGRAIFPF